MIPTRMYQLVKLTMIGLLINFSLRINVKNEMLHQQMGGKKLGVIERRIINRLRLKCAFAYQALYFTSVYLNTLKGDNAFYYCLVDLMVLLFCTCRSWLTTQIFSRNSVCNCIAQYISDVLGRTFYLCTNKRVSSFEATSIDCFSMYGCFVLFGHF